MCFFVFGRLNLNPCSGSAWVAWNVFGSCWHCNRLCFNWSGYQFELGIAKSSTIGLQGRPCVLDGRSCRCWWQHLWQWWWQSTGEGLLWWVEVCKWGMYASEYGCTTGFQCVYACADTMRSLKMSQCFKAHTFDMPKDKRLIRFVWTSYLFFQKKKEKPGRNGTEWRNIQDSDGSAEWNAFWDPLGTSELLSLGLDLWLVPLVAGFDATETYGIHAIIQLVMRCPWTPQMLYRWRRTSSSDWILPSRWPAPRSRFGHSPSSKRVTLLKKLQTWWNTIRHDERRLGAIYDIIY